eukprot:Phypoly_transcript_03829.p1 GENE.Phypoly_transcript_03829~~Phypoly_transcript_03829.p1  ORF type:complete len:407 (+),score=68.76 Phypoly_transcript_03829:865-2085(+)
MWDKLRRMMDSSQSDAYHEHTIKKVNYALGSAYVVLGLLSIIQVITKFKAERKLKTSVVFPAEILFLCFVRAIYFFLSLTTWSENNTPKYEGTFVFLVDTIPEIIFVAVYLLLVASWGTTWAKARRARPFAPSQFWATYCCTIGLIVIIAIGFSLLSSLKFHLDYDEVLLWEAAFVVVLSALSVFAALIFGVKLYLMLRETATKSTYLAHVMRQLLFLVALATVSSTLKGLCVYTISTSARDAWLLHKWTTFQFGALWVTYYVVTELLPFFVVWVVLQRKETSDKVTYSAISSSGKSRRESEMSRTTDSRRASEMSTNSSRTDSWRVSQMSDSRRASEISDSDSWRQSARSSSSSQWRQSESADARRIGSETVRVEVPKQGTKFVVLSEEDEYAYRDASQLERQQV